MKQRVKERNRGLKGETDNTLRLPVVRLLLFMQLSYDQYFFKKPVDIKCVQPIEFESESIPKKK